MPLNIEAALLLLLCNTTQVAQALAIPIFPAASTMMIKNLDGTSSE